MLDEARQSITREGGGGANPLRLDAYRCVADGADLGGFAHNGFPGMVRFGNGRLLVTWRQGAEHGTSTGASRGRILCSRSDDDGCTWSRPDTVVVDLDPADARAGLLSRMGDGRVALAYWGNAGRSSWMRTFVQFSADDGRTWSPATEVSSGFRRTGCESPVVDLGDGRLAVAVYARDEVDANHVAVVVTSHDDGRSFDDAVVVADEPSSVWVEPFLQRLADGTAFCMIREDGDPSLHGTWLPPGAKEWTPPRRLFPGSGRPAHLQLPGGAILCVYRREHPGHLPPVTLARVSKDLGRQWSEPVVIDAEDRSIYAQLALLSEREVGVTYGLERDRHTAEIRFRRAVLV